MIGSSRVFTFDVFTGGTDGTGLSKGAAQLELESSRRPRAQVVWQVFQEGSSRRLGDARIGVYSDELEIASATTGEDGQWRWLLRSLITFRS